MATDDERLSPALVTLIAELISRPDIQSVSCPFTDEGLWRLLIQEQVRRAAGSGLHPQHAFGLSGPDSGLPFDPADWGGYVHTPYEGACEADLFVNPSWRGFDLQEGMGDGSLSAVTLGKPCHHLLLWGHRKEIDCATRIHVAGWTLYSSKARRTCPSAHS